MKHLIFTIIITLFIGCGSTTKVPESEIDLAPVQPTLDTAKEIFTIGDDQSVLEGSSVQLSVSMLDKTKEFTKYSWKVDGKVLSTSEEFTSLNLSAGEHKVLLEATDKEGTVYKDTATVMIKKATASNTQPVAKSLNFVLKEDNVFKGSLSGSDADGDSLNYIFVSFPKHGKLSGSAAHLRYTPEANYNGKDSFVYKTNDGTIDSEYATVNIEIEAVNDAPVAYAQEVNVSEGGSIDIVLKGQDIDGDDLTFSIVDSPNGIFSGSGVNYTYEPYFDHIGSDSFTFTVNDGKSDSAPAMVKINIVSVNHAPIANDDNLTVGEGVENKNIYVLKNDISVDGNNSKLTIVSINIDNLQGTSIAVLSDDNKSIIYTPDENFSGTDILTYTLYDGKMISKTNATVMITVQRPFIMTVDINGSSELSFTIPTDSGRSDYNYSIDCNGTGNYELTSTSDYTCSYPTTGEYNISIIGNFPHIKFEDSDPVNRSKLLYIQQWGDIKWKSMYYAFSGCNKLQINATDIPILAENTSMSYMFYNTTNFNSDISKWDVSKVTDMSCMFLNASSFDQNISVWNVSKVTDMTNMFWGASSFNQNLGDWNISSVTAMNTVFNSSSLSNENYTLTLAGWLETGVKYDVSFGAQGKQVTNTTARDSLINDFRWTIVDGGVNHTPVANITSTSTTIKLGESVTFDASSSSDVDGDTINYHWSVNTATSSDEIFSYTFTTIGEHNVTLIVTDGKGGTSETSSLIVTVVSAINFNQQVPLNDASSSILWLELEDLDRDGDVDILANTEDEVFWYENRGDDTYTSKKTISDNNVRLAHAADINGDGYLDIIYAKDSLTICTNKKDKTFDCSSTIHSGIKADDNITSITVDDIDNDTVPDILTTSWHENTVNV